MSDFSSLFTPIKIGTMELPNRIVMAPMTVDYGLPDETPSDRQIAYYGERAAGGVGMIGLEVSSVDPDHRYQQHSLGLHSDFQIAGHKKLVAAIHAHGGKAQPQISHPGPESLDVQLPVLVQEILHQGTEPGEQQRSEIQQLHLCHGWHPCQATHEIPRPTPIGGLRVRYEVRPPS